MEYFLISILLLTGYLFVIEKQQEKGKIPFTDTLAKIN